MPELRSDARLREELGLPQDAPLVVVLSRLNRLKGIEYFLRAAVRISAMFGKARFLVVGDSIDAAYRNELETYAARIGLRDKILFTGFRTDVGSILSETAVSVLPSLSEGLPNALLESMAMGVPVVATHVGGNPEAVENGVTGLLVPPRDDAALAEAVCTFLQNPAMAVRFGEAGKRRIADIFSLERMVQETERLYMGLLSSKTRRSRTPEVAHA
jgi:glycosyltransferase involved in cell wall biosynthesis